MEIQSVRNDRIIAHSPAIKEKCKTMNASVVYNDIFEAAGGIDKCKSMSEEPRNKSQVYNASKSV